MLPCSLSLLSLLSRSRFVLRRTDVRRKPLMKKTSAHQPHQPLLGGAKADAAAAAERRSHQSVARHGASLLTTVGGSCFLRHYHYRHHCPLPLHRRHHFGWMTEALPLSLLLMHQQWRHGGDERCCCPFSESATCHEKPSRQRQYRHLPLQRTKKHL